MLPLFPVTTVGSWPRPPELLRAQRMKRLDQMGEEEFTQMADLAVLEVLRLQEEAGVDVVTDGEQRRDNFYSFVAEKLDGVVLMTLAEMLNIVEDKAGFERILQTLDVPAYAISNAVCRDRIQRRRPVAVDDFLFLKRHTDKPVKVTLPGPYLLTRSMYVPAVTKEAYPTKEDLGEDVVRVLRAELNDLVKAGADFIQFDEPVLTEVVFAQGHPRTFMCAALAARGDPTEELDFAAYLLNKVIQGTDSVRIGLHICRGNWSENEATLLRGSYHPLLKYLERLHVRQLVLEYATERAGDLLVFGDMELGLGVVNPRSQTIESPEQVKRSIELALRLYPADKLWLNPDCGFGTFSNRPVNTPEVAFRKLKAIAQAAATYRG
ncbi:MAG: vitamin-B12 independent methionine synthase [Dehalococcoidia bacterium]|nr:vitamin-B12 independent methionine synthase [Dehalococcoidia bacterium]